MGPPQPQALGAPVGALMIALEALRQWFEGLRVTRPAREARRRAFVERVGKAVETFATTIVNFGRPQQRRPRPPRDMNSAAVERPRRWRVRVHVYQLVGDRTQRLCKSVGVGGVYHTGVEVGGVEYGYGCHDESCTGVWKQLPKQLPRDFARGQAVHTSVIEMGEAVLTQRELQNVLLQLMAEFPGNEYSILHRNCNHFTVELCQRLVHRAPPEWINSAAHKGAAVQRAVGAASSTVASVANAAALNSRLLRAPTRLPALSKRIVAVQGVRARASSARAVRRVFARERADLAGPEAGPEGGAARDAADGSASAPRHRRIRSVGGLRERVRALRRPSSEVGVVARGTGSSATAPRGGAGAPPRPARAASASAATAPPAVAARGDADDGECDAKQLALARARSAPQPPWTDGDTRPETAEIVAERYRHVHHDEVLLDA